MTAGALQASVAAAKPKRALAVFLAVVLTALCAGLEPYEALASNLKNPQGVILPAAPQLAPIPPLPAPAIPGAGPDAKAGPIVAPVAAGGEPKTTLGVLQVAGAALGEARSDGAKGAAVDAIYGEAHRDEISPGLSGGVQTAELFPGKSSSLALDVPALAALARDPNQRDSDRRAAVKAIADRSDDPAKLALEEIGTQEGGSAADYEIKRLALRGLWTLGKRVSLPPISAEHEAQLLAELKRRRPRALAIDLDGTLTEGGAPVTSRTAAALADVSRGGTAVAVVSDRPERGRVSGEDGLRDAFAAAAPGDLAEITLGANRGAVWLSHDSHGETTAERAPEWSESERTGVQASIHAAALNAGLRLPADAFASGYDAFILLPGSVDDRALARMQAELARSTRGVAATVSVRRARSAGERPYVFVSKYDKSIATRRLRRGAGSDLELPGSSVLVVGDQFSGQRSGDAALLAGAPGALGLAAGGTADPIHDNVFVLRGRGPEATAPVLEALAPAPERAESASTLAKWAFFAQRTVSMSVFAMTAVAFVWIAIPIVSSASYAALMAFGFIAAMLAGPTMIAELTKRLSSRDVTLVNVAVRFVLHSALPAFWALGVLNFWTLLIAAIANGWLLSSIVSTDNILIRRLFGKENASFINLAAINYGLVQVAVLILVGFDRYTDFFAGLLAQLGLAVGSGTGRLMVPYIVSAAAHALIVAPLALLLPKMKPPRDAVESLERRGRSLFERAKRLVHRYWHATAGLAAAFYAYFYALPGLPAAYASVLVGSVVPLALAGLWWVSRTDAFRLWWSNKRARWALLLAGLAALVYQPVQGFLLPLAAGAMAGAAGKEQLYGELLGALVLGQLIPTAARAKLPALGRFDSAQLLRALVIGAAGLWSWMTLFPGSLVLAAAVAAGAATLMKLSLLVSERDWVRFFGLGMVALAVPWALTGSVPALLLAALVFGLFYGPAFVALTNQFNAAFPKSQVESMTAIQGSILNAAITIGYSLFQSSNLRHGGDVHGLLADVTMLAVAAGIVFALGVRLLPGLSRGAQTPKENLK